MRRRLGLGILALAEAGFGQHPSVLISRDFFPNEPAIAVDPRDPARMMAGANQDKVFHSEDSGRTWRGETLTSLFNVRGDPALVADTTGAFYFFHLSDSMNGGGYFLDRIVCQRLDAGDTVWTPGAGIGHNPPRAGQDKEWAAVDLRTNALYVAWTQFDSYGSTDPSDSTNILFSRSADRGATWSAPMRLNRMAGDCRDSGSAAEGANPAVGPNGEIYVSWMGPDGLMFDRSTDGGATWLDPDIRVDSMPGGWNLAIPDLVRANGFPVTASDVSSGPYRGNVYVVWSDQQNGSADTDIWFRRSLDGGLTWGPRRRVNDDPPGSHQFFPWMTVDPATGYIWIVFYDRRNHAGRATDVYLACSRDGGATFVNFRISNEPFPALPGIFLGDYIGISAVQGVVRPVWIRFDSVPPGSTTSHSIWTALVDTARIGEDQSAIRFTAKRRGGVRNPWRVAAPNFGSGSPYFDVLGRRHGPSRPDPRLLDPDLPPASGYAPPEEWKEEQLEEEREDFWNRILALALLFGIAAAGLAAIRSGRIRPGSGIARTVP